MFENFDRRKAIIIVGIALALIVLGWLTYLALRPAVPPPTPVNNANAGLPGLPSAGGRNLNFPGEINLPITPEGNVNVNVGELPAMPPGVVPEVSAPAITQGPVAQPDAIGGQVRYYDPADCKFYEQSGSSRQALSSATYCSVQNITWSPQGSSAILEFPDSANIVYDFNTQKQYTLPKEMTEFSFSPDSTKIAGKFMADDPADRWVVSINPDGSGLAGIEPMGENADKVNVEWSPNQQVVALARTGEPAGLFQQQVLLIGFHGENFKSLTVDGRGFEPKWTPDGSRLLYSVYSDQSNYRPTLWLVDATPDRAGANKQSLSLQTWADKCTMTAEAAFCAVPVELPEGAGFTRELARGIPDTIWRVDLKTGATALVTEPRDEAGNGITAASLTVSSDGKSLYFTDAASGKLRSVKVE